MKKTVVAICYDFDKTLSTDTMQSVSFVPALNMTPDEFWSKTNAFEKKYQCDSTLAYLKMMVDECKARNIRFDKNFLHSLGKKIKFYPGVTTWFNRINNYAKQHNIVLEHYIISSGNKEIIEGCSIAKYFKNIFACEFLFDKSGVACWPKNLVNYTQKTQYLFRICKGATNLSDNEIINKHVTKKHVEFRNIIYLGDGFTDIPCMTLVKEKGGNSISVYSANDKEQSLQLIKDNRVNYTCQNNFKSGSTLENLVKLILTSIELKEKLIAKESKIKNN